MRKGPALSPFFFLGLTAIILVTPRPACAGDLQDRPPAVAGQFYPADPEELRGLLRSMLLRAAHPAAQSDPLALIVPHAGYVFSGEVAARAFSRLDSTGTYRTIFLLGSSHRIGFEGAAVYAAGDFLTPLGRVKVDRAAVAELLRADQLFSDRTDAHGREHSLEVQLPFLQMMMRKPFAIVPVVIGAQRPETCRRIAAVLAPYLKAGNLFVVSTDLSHYPAYDDAVRADRAVTDAITGGSPETFRRTVEQIESSGIPGLETAICGWSAVLTLMEMTRSRPDLAYELLHYRNSGDTPRYGDRRQVVGYAALQLVPRTEHRIEERPAPPKRSGTGDGKVDRQPGDGLNLGSAERTRLLAIARATVEATARGEREPEVDPATLPAALRAPAGAFVTLHARGELRGCIGRFEASEPLFRTVRSMAVAASTQDPRFPPVAAGELRDIRVEISVLTPMRRIISAGEFTPGKHGIYIRKGNRSGTFLPQVAGETGWSKEELLGHCSRDKAGLGWDGWKDAELYVYEALVFGETEH